MTAQHFIGKILPPPLPEPVRRPKLLSMRMSAEEAFERWHAHWLRSTDPAHRGGDSRQLACFRERFERLVAHETFGTPVEPVAVPDFDREAVRPSHFTFSELKGTG